jgi:hypothetical protein
MPSYAEELAAWRAQRRQAEIADRAQQIQQEHAQYARERDEAITRNDMEEASYADNACEDLEKEYYKIVPPQRPQMPAQAQEWVLQNKPFFDRYGPRADEAVRAAHAYVIRPRVPGETNPSRTGCGLRAYTKPYWDALETALQMHGPTFYGVQYDPGEKLPTVRDAAEASTLSLNEYANAAQTMIKAGRIGNPDGR